MARSKEESLQNEIEANQSSSHILEKEQFTKEEYYALSSPSKLGKEGQYLRFPSVPTNKRDDGGLFQYDLDSNDFYRTVGGEMNMRLIQNEQESNGATLVMGKSRISTFCTIPNVVR